MTLKTYNGSSFETVPYRYYDGSNWRGTPVYRYNGTEWVDAYLDGGLVAYYPFDGDVTDYSGQGNDGTDNTSAGFASGRIGSDSKSLDGTDDYVEIPSIVFDETDDWSFGGWFKTSQSSNQRVISQDDDGSGPGEWNLRLTDSDSDSSYELNSFVRDQNGNGGGVFSSTAVDDGQWHHGMTVVDAPNGDVKLYLDGGQVASDTFSFNTTFDSTFPINLGRFQGGGSYFAGELDEVRIYSRGLSSAEIDTLYQQGRVI